MRSWKLKKKMTPNSKVDEIIPKLNQNLRVNMVKKLPKFLEEHAIFDDHVLRHLHRHNFRFLGKDGRKNHYPNCSW